MNEIFELKNINKSFGRHKVLNDISLFFRKGEIHSIVGENGAGKTTLMKIIGGIYDADSGEILKNTKKLDIKTPIDAFNKGIGLIHQELSVFGNMSVSHNIFVNREPVNAFGFVNWKAMNQVTIREFEKIGLNINPEDKVEKYSVGIQQIIEIVKTLSLNAELLIMDEPTSALSNQETKILFELLFDLKVKGTSIIFISHKLSEVLYLSDRISVLRDGNLIGTLDRANANISKIINMMVGRSIDQLYPPKAKERNGKVVLKVINLSKTKEYSDINFSLKRGEILGLFGLIGSGRTELAYSIIGASKFDSGKILLDNSEIKFKSPRQAVNSGVCYLTEDRRNLGLFLIKSVEENISSSSMDSITNKYGLINSKASYETGEKYINLLDIVPKDPEIRVQDLSGGNQQKVLLGKWLATTPKVLIADEPTRGVDVGAKAKIHKMLRELANQGIAILLISSELPEVIGVSDRVMIMHEGVKKAILKNEGQITEKLVMEKAFEERSYLRK